MILGLRFVKRMVPEEPSKLNPGHFQRILQMKIKNVTITNVGDDDLYVDGARLSPGTSLLTEQWVDVPLIEENP